MPGPTTITPSNGTWVKAGKWRPGGLAGTPIYPANGTWVVVGQCLLPTRFQYNSIGLPAKYSTRQFAVGSNSQG